MSGRPAILIASSSFDEHTHGPVHRHLARWGWDVVVYLTDRVLDGRERFSLDIEESGRIEMLYEGRDIAPSVIAAAWYWKVANFRVADAEHNVAKQLSLVNELTQCNSSIWSLYPDAVWLSPPSAIAAAERKLRQLIVARQVGFQIPRTHMGNDWDLVERAFSDDARGMVVKPFRGVIAEHNEIRAMYTTHLTDSLLRDLRRRTIPFPGIYQPFLPKAREWRVTVVDSDVFAGAIYTDDTAKDDWRRLQETAAVALRREPLPDAIADLCRAYLSTMRLRLGSFDLVEQPDGQVIFLECNASGQFGFLEEILELPISEAIAQQLAAIANVRAS